MHKLIERQLRRHLPKHLEADDVTKLASAISQAYEEYERDRLMLERALTITSDELNEINRELRAQLEANQETQQQLEQSLITLSTTLNATREAILTFRPDGTLYQINRQGRQLLKASAKESYDSLKFLLQVTRRLTNPKAFLNEVRRIRFDKKTYLHGYIETENGQHLEYYSVPELQARTLIGRVWCLRDITDIRKNEELLEHQAFHDNLTGLPNRLLLLETLKRAIPAAKRRTSYAAILFIDLDNFKKINDAAGHDLGDRFLIQIADEIKECLRVEDVFGRLGGDEFLIILESVFHQRDITRTCQRIIDVFNQPRDIAGQNFFVTGSIGISLYPLDGDDADLLIRKADMAMYEAKRQGKNNFQYYDESLERRALHQLEIENKLREAITEGQFQLAYQPEIDLKTKQVVGVEALLRWYPNPDEPPVPPDQFITIAEQTNLIYPLTDWVINEVCQTLVSWRGSAMENIPISINISALDFKQTEFIDRVCGPLKKHKLSGDQLVLELTESVFLEGSEAIRDRVQALKKEGLKLAIDDFGTGYSSFRYLQHIPIDYLKIDRSFVSGLPADPQQAAIAKSIIDIGINLGVSIIAEGIEEDTELQFLTKAKCHIGQGYFFSRPIPEPDLREFINNR